MRVFGRCLLLLLAAGCGPLELPLIPMPFERSAAEAARDGLIRPPPARIVVPPSTTLGLDEAAARRFATHLAAALREAELPATAADIPRPDYRLLAAGEAEGGAVRLTYTLVDQSGAVLAATGGPRAVPAAGWMAGEEATLRAAAAEAVPAVAAMLARLEAARQGPTAAAAALPTLRLEGVSGAPGDGDRALDRAMRTALAREGVLVTEGGAGEFALAGRVTVLRLSPRSERVEILWRVSRTDGTELGTVSQLNEIPRGALDGRWGDVAAVVAEQAAAGVAAVIRRARAGG